MGRKEDVAAAMAAAPECDVRVTPIGPHYVAECLGAHHFEQRRGSKNAANLAGLDHLRRCAGGQP